MCIVHLQYFCIGAEVCAVVERDIGSSVCVCVCVRVCVYTCACALSLVCVVKRELISSNVIHTVTSYYFQSTRSCFFPLFSRLSPPHALAHPSSSSPSSLPFSISPLSILICASTKFNFPLLNLSCSHNGRSIPTPPYRNTTQI